MPSPANGDDNFDVSQDVLIELTVEDKVNELTIDIQGKDLRQCLCRKMDDEGNDDDIPVKRQKEEDDSDDEN